jgi:hypothetical protein
MLCSSISINCRGFSSFSGKHVENNSFSIRTHVMNSHAGCAVEKLGKKEN